MGKNSDKDSSSGNNNSSDTSRESIEDVISDNMDLNDDVSDANSSADSDTANDSDKSGSTESSSDYRKLYEDTNKKLTSVEEKLTAAQEAVAFKDLIEDDPQALALLRKHFGVVEDESSGNDSSSSNNQNDTKDDRIAKLEAELARVRAATQVIDFKNQHPEMEKYKDGMAELLNNTPGLSLSDALLLAKAKAGDLDGKPSHEGVEGGVSGTSNDRPELSDLLKTVTKAGSAKDAVKHIVNAVDAGFTLD